MDDVILLIADGGYYDAYGVYKKTETSRQVFAQVNSITRAEFFNGGRNGLNPQMMFKVFAGDYEGEKVVEYQGKRYAIYRTYKGNKNGYVGPNTSSRQELLSDYIELYVERKAGTDGAQEDNSGPAGTSH